MAVHRKTLEYGNCRGTYCSAVFQAVWHIADTHDERYDMQATNLKPSVKKQEWDMARVEKARIQSHCMFVYSLIKSFTYFFSNKKLSKLFECNSSKAEIVFTKYILVRGFCFAYLDQPFMRTKHINFGFLTVFSTSNLFVVWHLLWRYCHDPKYAIFYVGSAENFNFFPRTFLSSLTKIG